MPTFKPPGDCPACGEWVPRGSAACPDCGACPKSGWREDESIYDGVDLPEYGGEFRYDQRKRPANNLWWWAGVLLAIAFVFGLLAPLLSKL